MRQIGECHVVDWLIENHLFFAGPLVTSSEDEEDIIYETDRQVSWCGLIDWLFKFALKESYIRFTYSSLGSGLKVRLAIWDLSLKIITTLGRLTSLLVSVLRIWIRMDPPTLTLVGWIRILIQGKIDLQNKSKQISYFVVLTQLDVFFRGLNASPVAWTSCMKNFSIFGSCNFFFKFLVILTPGIRIRNRIHIHIDLKTLDPDPDPHWNQSRSATVGWLIVSPCCRHPRSPDMGSVSSYSNMQVSQPDLENVKPGQIGKPTTPE